MSRPKIYPERMERLDIRIPASMKEELRARKINISDLARRLFSKYLNHGSEEEKIKKKLEELEPHHLEYHAAESAYAEIKKRKLDEEQQEIEVQARKDRVFEQMADLIKKFGPDAYKLDYLLDQAARELGVPLDEVKAEFEHKYPRVLVKLIPPWRRGKI